MQTVCPRPDVSLPAKFNHRPVSLITIHSNLHTSAAACYLTVKSIVRIKFLEEALKLFNIYRSRSSGYISSVEQNVYSCLLDALVLGFCQHLEQVLDI